MATSGVKLSMVFKDANDQNMTMNYNYADPNVETTAVQALMAGIITNGSIFAKAPVRMKSAEIVTTSVRQVDLT